MILFCLEKGSAKEWDFYKDILDCFCVVMGMIINPNKYIFLIFVLEANEFGRLKDLFPFRFKPLDLGIKYFSYLIKPNNYSREDCSWLINKFEKRLANWCNMWLSLGG